jgi:hypothetical protein
MAKKSMENAVQMEAEVLKHLKNGPKTNGDLREAIGLSPTRYDPHLDRALQRLRKEGKIVAESGKWRSKEFKTCPTCGGCGFVIGA